MVTRQIAALFAEVRMKTTGLTGDVAKIQNELGALATFVKAHPVAAIASLGVAMVGVAAQAVRMASEVDAALRQMAAAMPTGMAGIDKLRTDLQQFARDTGRLSGDVQAAALATAREGVTGPEELMVRLKAVGRVADVVGGDMAQRAREAEQVMGIFGIQSAEWEKALAKLWAATRGKASWDEMIGAIIAGSRGVRGTKGDFDVATGAISALLQAEYQMRDIRQIINRATPEQLQELANMATTSADALGDLRKASDEVRGGADRIAASIRGELTTQLQNLGNVLLPVAVGWLKDLNTMLARLSGQHNIGVDIAITGTAFGEKLQHGVESAREAMGRIADAFDPLTWKGGGFGKTSAYEEMAKRTADRIAKAAAEAAARQRDDIRSTAASYERSFLDIQRGAKATADLTTDLFQRAGAAARAAMAAPVGPIRQFSKANVEALASTILPQPKGTGGKSDNSLDALTRQVQAFQDQIASLRASLTLGNPFDDINTRFDLLAREAAMLDVATKGVYKFAEAIEALRKTSLAQAAAAQAEALNQRVQGFTDQIAAMRASLTAGNPFDDIIARFDVLAREAAALDASTDGVHRFVAAIDDLRAASLGMAQQAIDEAARQKVVGVEADIAALQADVVKMATSLAASGDPLAGVTDTFDAMRERALALGTALTALGRKTDDVTFLLGKIEELRGVAIAAKAGELGRLVDDTAIQLSATLVDDLRKKYEGLAKAARDAARAASAAGDTVTAGLRARQAAAYEDTGRQAAQAQQTIEAITKELAEFQAKVPDGMRFTDPDQIFMLGSMAAIVEQILATEIEDNTVRENAKALLDQLLKKIGDLGGGVFQVHEKTKKANDSLLRTVNNLRAGAEAAVQLAEAMGLVDDKTQQTLSSSIELAAGIGLLLGGEYQQGAASTLSGLTGLLNTLTGDDPQDRERRKELARNTDAIHDLTTHIGDLSKFTVTGDVFADVRAGLSSLLAMTGDAGGFRRFGQKGSPLRHMDPKQYFESLGIDWSDVEQVARDAGITLNGTKQSYLDLMDALRKMDLQVFLDSWTGQMAQFTQELKLFDIESPLAQYTQFLKRLAGEKGAPELFGALADIDVKTEEGRQAMKEAIRKIFQGMADGTLDFATKYGNLTPAELQEALGRLFDFLEGIAQEYTRAFDALTESFTVHGTGAAEQLAALGHLFGSEFAALSGVMDGINIGSADDLATLRTRLQAIYDTLAEGEGGITEDERLIADAILTMLGAIDAAAGEAATKAAQALGDAQDAFAVLGTDAADQVGELADLFAQRWDDFQGVLADADLTTKDGIDALRDRLRGMLAIWQEGGLTDEEREMIDALKTLLSALDAAGNAIQTFAQEMNDAFREIDLEARVFGEEAPATLGRKLTKFGLIGFDVTSEAGQAKVLTQLQAMFAAADAETKQVIGELVDQLRAVMQATAAATNAEAEAAAGARQRSGPNQVGQVQLTERQGVELTDLARVGNLIAREQLATLTRIADALAASGGGALIRPPMLGTFALGGGAGGGDIIVSVRVNVTGVDPAKAYQVGQDIGAGITTSVESINRDLGGALRLDRRRRGSVELQ